MKLCVLVVAVALAAVQVESAKRNPNGSTDIDLNEVEQLFTKFQRDYNRRYKDECDRAVHFEAFYKTLLRINYENRVQPKAIFGINQFADYTEDELKNWLK